MIMVYYHYYFLHVDITHLFKMTGSYLSWPGLTKDLEDLVSTFNDCQPFKMMGNEASPKEDFIGAFYKLELHHVQVTYKTKRSLSIRVHK